MNDSESQYLKTLEYLYSFVDFSMQHMHNLAPDAFDLTRMVALAAALGDPQKGYPIIHVAGTKGKGSVSVLCASALQAAGYRVGLYTSPHLDDYAERITVNGQQIPHADLVALVHEVKPVIASIPRLSTFEITTALAFLYFARQNVSAAVIEVGLGGRLDATNIIQPKVSVITSLSYDHQYLLGSTLAEIAGEKAGIIKAGIPVVVSPQAEEASLVLEKFANQRNAQLVRVGRDYAFALESHSLDGQTFLVWSQSGREINFKTTRLTIPLLGQHQVVNAVTAYAALQVANQNGVHIDVAAIRQGFTSVHWPGRFEILRRDPPVVLDCAHNRDSALKLRQTLDDYFPSLPVVMVFGASEDKDVKGMFSELISRVQQLVIVKSFHPRAMDPDELMDLADEFGVPARLVPDVADGMLEALRLAGDQTLVLVTGSIFVVAGARIAWYKKTGAENPREG